MEGSHTRRSPGASRPPHHPLPLAGDRRVDRADGRRRRRGRQALDALVSEPRRSRQACLRGEPADAQGARSRCAAAERRRLPLGERRRDEEPGSARRDGARGEGKPARAHELVLLDRQRRCTRRADRHTTFMQVYPPGPDRLDVKSGAAKMRAVAATGLPAGITVDVTGYARSKRQRCTARAAARASCWRR